ncbi:hypothetical protein RRG08_026100 [Elysia crispata]|uniref:Uncharacterized protein n=1 Tax=Elysia crispata TaxID=231223 RepID=A0AAE0YRN4_9GAST|nr:hypothetical protein RRG08_026100 [Elysia crispata]
MNDIFRPLEASRAEVTEAASRQTTTSRQRSPARVVSPTSIVAGPNRPVDWGKPSPTQSSYLAVSGEILLAWSSPFNLSMPTSKHTEASVDSGGSDLWI